MIAALPLWSLLVVFAGCAAVIWFAGIRLSVTTDVLDERLHLGSALGGLVVLGVATNLPELVITVTAAASGSVQIAVGNVLGGIALQTVVIAVLDLVGRRARGAPPLTYRAASLTLVVEALVVLGVLAIVLAGTQLPAGLSLLRVTPEAALIALAWVAGLLLIRRARTGLPWRTEGGAPGATPRRRRAHPHARTTPASRPATSLARTVVGFALAALATLVAGFVLEQTGDALAGRLGLSGVVFGATLLALATSLPEISTGLQAIRQGDDDLAISDILGGNAFLPVLFLIAGLISGRAVLPTAGGTDIYLTALAALLTVVYALGLLFRPRRRVLGVGVDSLVVLLVYLVGVAGLLAITVAAG